AARSAALPSGPRREYRYSRSSRPKAIGGCHLVLPPSKSPSSLPAQLHAATRRSTPCTAKSELCQYDTPDEPTSVPRCPALPELPPGPPRHVAGETGGCDGGGKWIAPVQVVVP